MIYKNLLLKIGEKCDLETNYKIKLICCEFKDGEKVLMEEIIKKFNKFENEYINLDNEICKERYYGNSSDIIFLVDNDFKIYNYFFRKTGDKKNIFNNELSKILTYDENDIYDIHTWRDEEKILENIINLCYVNDGLYNSENYFYYDEYFEFDVQKYRLYRDIKKCEKIDDCSIVIYSKTKFKNLRMPIVIYKFFYEFELDMENMIKISWEDWMWKIGNIESGTYIKNRLINFQCYFPIYIYEKKNIILINVNEDEEDYGTIAYYSIEYDIIKKIRIKLLDVINFTEKKFNEVICNDKNYCDKEFYEMMYNLKYNK